LLFDCCDLKPEPRARTVHTAATKAQPKSARAQSEPPSRVVKPESAQPSALPRGVVLVRA
jgi:hypothetical protein